MAGTAVTTRVATAVLCLIATSALAACGSSSPSSTSTPAGASLAAGCRPASAADQSVTARTYVFLLHMGSPEQMVMVSAAQAKAKHMTGELMIGGSMAGMSSGAMNGHMTTRHLEVHICDRASGKVVTGATPAITVAPSAGGAPEHVPVAVMEGIYAGGGDLHYGNNVPLHPGSSYTIAVRLGADGAAFKYTVPPGT